MNNCLFICDTHKGKRCDLTNSPCNHARPCELAWEAEDEREDEQVKQEMETDE
jgi:hypothetical protein